MSDSDLYCYAIVETGDGTRYIRFHKASDTLDQDFTGTLSEMWQGTPEQEKWLAAAEQSGRSIPVLYRPETDKIYILDGDTYLRGTFATHTLDEGYPQNINLRWPGIDTTSRPISTLCGWNNQLAFVFHGTTYSRYSLTEDRVDAGYPQDTGVKWPGLGPAGMADSPDVVFRWDDDWAYVLKGGNYVRFHIPSNKTDQAALKTVDNWKAYAQAGVRRVRAMWAGPAVQNPVISSTATKALQNGGFPTGNFKIRNEETGKCLEAVRVAGQGKRYKTDDKGNHKEVADPQSASGGSYMGLESCRDTRDQLWRYNPKTKQLENVGNVGRVASLDYSAARHPHNEVSFEEEQGSGPNDDAPQWKVNLASGDRTVSSEKVQFKTVDGYIVLANPQEAHGDQTYWTAEKDSRGFVFGCAKGQPRQKWTFTTVS